MSVSKDFGAMLQQLADFVSAFGPALKTDLVLGASRYSRITSNDFGLRGFMAPCSNLEVCIFSILPQSM